MDRREFLTGAAWAGALAALSGCGVARSSPAILVSARRRRPLALVYRGPASCPGCPEAVAALLESAPSRFVAVYCGPRERVALTAEALARADLYAQPGGGELAAAWKVMRAHARDIRCFVDRGGRYLGFCLGGYLAGATPGFALLPGDSDEYITQPDATVHRTTDTIIAVRWRHRRRHLYFQDGPCFRLGSDPATTVLATYRGGEPAAVVAGYGSGRVGVVGPHPEADRSWYADARLTNPDGVRFDLGHDLVETTYR